MAHALPVVRKRPPHRLLTAALAVVVAMTLIAGVFNLRPLLARITNPAIDASAPPSAVASLVGIDQGARPETVLDRQIADLQTTLRGNDPLTRGKASSLLGAAYLQKARETGDPGYYPKAEALLQQALAENESDVEAMIGLGVLALARHQFAEGETWGEKALVIDPSRARTYGVIADAQVELGRYEDAVRTVQEMVNLRPDLASYSRVSYLRELMGDREGALAAMEQAAVAGSGYPENIAWVQVQLGNLRFDGGDLTGAQSAYDNAISAVPGYAAALAGQAKVAAAKGDFTHAAALYQQAVQATPLPDYLAAYGDILTAAGRSDEAATQYAMVRAIQQIYTANGVDTDLELALFSADHSQPADLTKALADAEAAVALRPSIAAYDVLAWTRYQHGDLDGAEEAITQALRLGTKSALMHFHAGMIASARGDTEAAISHLSSAVQMNPYFSVRYAPVARAELARLQQIEAES